MAKSSASRKYLKILGIVEMVLAGIGLIASIAMFFIKGINVADFGLENLDQLRQHFTDEQIKNVVFGVGVVACLINLWVAWIIYRAGATNKTTLALVLVVLQCISGAATIFSSLINHVALGFSTVISLTIYVLAFIAIMNVRSESKN